MSLTHIVKSEDLAKTCATCSGHAFKFMVHNQSAGTLYVKLESHVPTLRVVDAGDESALDDSAPTIIKGYDKLSNIEQRMFWEQMFKLRFRNALFITSDQFKPGIPAWLLRRVQNIEIG